MARSTALLGGWARCAATLTNYNDTTAHHERLAEALDLGVALALGVEVGAALCEVGAQSRGRWGRVVGVHTLQLVASKLLVDCSSSMRQVLLKQPAELCRHPACLAGAHGQRGQRILEHLLSRRAVRWHG